MLPEIPTAVTLAEAAELQRLARGKHVLEVGALLGYSTITLAKVAAHVVSVDPHEGYPQDNPRPTLNTYLNNLERHGVRDRVTVCVDYHDRVLPWLGERQFRMAFVDCTGEYDLTLDVIQHIIPLLTHHAYLCVHDCGHPDWPGAMDAAKALGRPFRLVDRMAVFAGTWH